MPRTKLPEGSVSVTFRLPPEVRRSLLEKARQQQITFSELLRRVLRREMGGGRPRARRRKGRIRRGGGQ